LQPSVPRDLETICLKCLRKLPRQRYASAAELAADLRRFLTGQPIQAQPTSRLERVVKWTRRQPALAALAAVGILVALGSLAAWIAFTARLSTERDHARRGWERALEQEALARSHLQLAEEERRRAEKERDRADGQRERAEALLFRCPTDVTANAQVVEHIKGEMRPEVPPGSLFFAFARFFALTSARYDADATLLPDDRRALSEQYATRAVNLLDRSWKSGYFREQRHLERLKTESDLACLRSRADFRHLLSEVERPVRLGRR
jgi:hypothetical protein